MVVADYFIGGGMSIHKTALIHPDAIIGDNVEIGPFTIIDKGVVIGKGTRIGAHVIIEGDTEIGQDCQIYTGAIIGNVPQDLKYKGEETKVIIGNNNIIREYVTINRGTVARGKTVIGNDNLIMAYVHIAHDCTLDNKIVLANGVTLAGHIYIEDLAIIGGLTPIHQFVRIGTLAIVGGNSRVVKDVPPYCKAAGNPMRLFGLNSIGMERNQIPQDVRTKLKSVYRILFRSRLNTTQAIEMIEKGKFDDCEELKHFINFIKESERGICKE